MWRPGLRQWPWQQLPFLAAVAVAIGALPVAAQRLDASEKADTFEATVDGRTRKMGVSLSGNYRWLYDAQQKTCESGTKAEMEACFLQGIDSDTYRGTYGVYVADEDATEVQLRYASFGQYATQPNYGTRVFITDMDSGVGSGYYMFDLMGKEFSFSIDLQNVPAGMNAAVYFVSMDALGNAGVTYEDGEKNEAGWQRGTGYCDAQCPKDVRFVQDVGYNPDGQIWSCCPEMDIFEGNRFAAAMTAHPCTSISETACNANTSTCTNPCDTDGADMNLFRSLGPASALFELVDLQKLITIRTKFRTNDGGELESIEQVWEQDDADGNPVAKFNMTITDEGVAKQKEIFEEHNRFAEIGGVAQMGRALERGMVLTLALWSDDVANMNWLDSCTKNDLVYNCSLQPMFNSSDIFWEAWRGSPGSWRGPADFYPSLATSYATETVEFSYPLLPTWMKSQSPFHCSDVAGVYDCANVKYAFSVRNLAVRALKDSHHQIPWFWICVGVAAVIVAGLAACCCWPEREEEYKPRRLASRGKGKGKGRSKGNGSAYSYSQSSSEDSSSGEGSSSNE